MTVERMRDRGVCMLTVYSPNPCATQQEYLERYPGDAWVDILGLDAYHSGDAGAFASKLGTSLAIMERIAGEHRKPMPCRKPAWRAFRMPTGGRGC